MLEHVSTGRSVLDDARVGVAIGEERLRRRRTDTTKVMCFISRESHVGAEHENSETFALSTASLLRRAASAGSGDDRAFRGRRDG